MFRNYKKTLVLVSLLLVVLVGFGVYTVLIRAGKEPVQVYLVPSDANLTANGEKISAGIAYLKPGTYTVEATRGGFSSQKETITIGQPNKTDIDIALQGVSKSAIEWQEKHQSLYLEREGRGGKRATARGIEFSNLNPITTKLPFENLLYTIGYRLDPTDPAENSIIIEIDAGPGYRRAALQKIRELGYDPTDFKIKFNNYTSPFDHE